MPSIIRILDEQTINKIAAGEVIENTSSVVKELVENSLDSGATEICVEIKGGGRQLIRVTDNGCGMNKDDSLLCLERHATSKIKAVEDIQDISTMGFRGEALPSIASISKFTLLTCPKGATHTIEDGTLLIVEGGRMLKCSDAVRSPGTTIEVKELFFNVPVRKKFQKSPQHDVNEILKMLSLLALGNPSIQFELISQEKVLLSTRGSNGPFQEALKARIKEVMGDEFVHGLIPIEREKEGFTLRGFIGQPHFNRHNRTGQSLFVNRRGIHSLFLSYCVKDGYGTTLSENRHPVFVLHLEMPGTTVDVNVHPQKREVRVRQEHILKALVLEAIEEALQKTIFQPSEFSCPTVDISLPHHREENMECKPNSFSFEHILLQSVAKEPHIPFTPSFMPETSYPKPSFQPLFFAEESKKSKTFRVLATLNRFILLNEMSHAPSQVTLFIVDQRAAHSRVIFEQLCASKQQTILQQQSLLIPYTWKASLPDVDLIREALPFFNEIGMNIHAIGPCEFLIDALPTLFGNVDIQLLIHDLLLGLHEGHADTHVLRLKEKQIALAASRAAVSSKARLQIEDAQVLINRLMECGSPYQCPQGNPTMAAFTHDDLDKLLLKNAYRE